MNPSCKYNLKPSPLKTEQSEIKYHKYSNILTDYYKRWPLTMKKIEHIFQDGLIFF